MDETFKVVTDYINYSVSDLGRVMNNKTGRILKQREDKDGYFRVNLYGFDNIKTVKIHRLVAEAFLENVENKEQVDHIDNNKQNNNVKNLRYVTTSENGMNQKISKIIHLILKEYVTIKH